jgi:uncharacterized protein with FMN-binding domain
MKIFTPFVVLGGILTLVMVLFVTGCPTDGGDNLPEPIAGNPTGTASASAAGFAAKAPEYLAEHGGEFGRQVTVMVTVTDGYIKNINIDGPDETASIGQAAFEPMKKKIMDKNNFDLTKADKVSGATYTCDAIIEAGKAALQKIITGQ